MANSRLAVLNVFFGVIGRFSFEYGRIPKWGQVKNPVRTAGI
jgi:hypothetical protein